MIKKVHSGTPQTNPLLQALERHNSYRYNDQVGIRILIQLIDWNFVLTFLWQNSMACNWVKLQINLGLTFSSSFFEINLTAHYDLMKI